MTVRSWLDLMAVVVGALAGVLVGHERKLDLVGFIGMCLICALGGGLLRDAIMQVGDVYVLNSKLAIPFCVITALVGFAFPSVVTRHPGLYEWVDMFSVAMFVLAGTSKAYAYGLHTSAGILMGVLTGVGGGMLRDVFLGEVPQVFQRSNLYALCAMTGAAVYWICMCLGLAEQVANVATVLVVVAMRRVSLRYDILSPADVDLTPQVAHMKDKMTSHKK